MRTAILEAPIHHERTPHCIGCWVIYTQDNELYAECNECHVRRDILAFLTEEVVAPPADLISAFNTMMEQRFFHGSKSMAIALGWDKDFVEYVRRDRWRAPPAASGAYTWIREAALVLSRATMAQGVPGSSLGLDIDALLSGVPVPNKDLGFGSPADRAARQEEDAALGAKLREKVASGHIDLRDIMDLFPNLRSARTDG